MKILTIRGENLASLSGPFEVNLNAGPLQDCGLFAITGQTGSGKTTLLDAVCLALYNTTPRLDQRGGAKIGRADQAEGDRLQANDVRGLLSRGKVSGFAEVDFIGRDAHTYRARWGVRRSRNKVGGRLQDITWSVAALDDQAPISGKKAEVKRAILDRIGLSFEQFRRSALLAQGDFAAFLKAGEDERAELLERMTGTEIYSQLSVAAHERQRAEGAQLKALEQEVVLLGVLTTDVRSELEAQQQREAAEAETRKAEWSRASADHRWWTHRADLMALIAAAQAERDRATEAVAGSQADKEHLERIIAADKLRPQMEGLDVATAGLSTAKTSLQAADLAAQSRAESARTASEALLRATEAHGHALERRTEAEPTLRAAEDLDRALVELRAQGTTAAAAQASAADALSAAQLRQRAAIDAQAHAAQARSVAEAWLQAHPHATRLHPQWPRVADSIDRLMATRGEIDTVRTEAANLAKVAVEAREIAARAQADSDRAKAAEDQAQVQAKQAREQVPPLMRTMVESARETATTARHNAQTARRLATAAATLNAKLAQSRTTAEQAAASADESHAALQTHEQERGLLDVRLDEATGALTRAHAAATLEERRHQLTPGEPCDLCGSTDHPWARDEGLAPVVSVHAERVRAIRDQIEECAQRITEWSARKTSAQATFDTATAREHELQHELDELAHGWSQLQNPPADLPPRPDLPNSQDAANRWFTAAQADLERAEAAVTRVHELVRASEQARTQAEEARQARDQQLKEAEAATRDRERAELASNQANASLESLQATIAQATDELRSTLAGRPQGWEDLQADPQAAREALYQETKAFERHTQTLSTIAKEAPGLAVEASSAQAQTIAATTDLSAADESVQATDAALSTTQTQRQSLLGGRPVEAVRRELDAAVSSTADLALAARETLTQAQVEAGKAEGTQEEARTQLRRATRAVDEAAARLDQALAGAGITLPALRQALERDPHWIATEQGRLRDLDDAVVGAKGRLAERNDRLNAHLEQGQPEGDAEGSHARLHAATAAHEAAAKALAATTARLDSDDHKRLAAQEQQRAIDAQHQVFSQWQRLASVIGSSDGKRFRNFAQGLTLDVLIAHANTHLQSLAPRYRLDRVPEAHLALQVIDQDMGDEIRSVNSLSGGESFLTSLALALGLSSLSAASTPVHSLFIDEGFGTLDAETLDLAFEALNTLHATGRQVGIISHVDALTERVGVQVRVERMGAGRSRVVVAESFDAPAL